MAYPAGCGGGSLKTLERNIYINGFKARQEVSKTERYKDI